MAETSANADQEKERTSKAYEEYVNEVNSEMRTIDEVKTDPRVSRLLATHGTGTNDSESSRRQVRGYG